MLQPDDSSQASNGEETTAASLQPMGFTDILDSMFSLYRNHFRLFVSICSVYFVCGFIVNLLIGISTVSAINSGEFNILMFTLVAGILSLINSVVMLFVIGGLVFGSAQVFLGKRIDRRHGIQANQTQVLALPRKQSSLRVSCRVIDHYSHRYSVCLLFWISLDILQSSGGV